MKVECICSGPLRWVLNRESCTPFAHSLRSHTHFASGIFVENAVSGKTSMRLLRTTINVSSRAHGCFI